MRRKSFSQTRVNRLHCLRGGFGSMWDHNGVMRPQCWYRVQLRLADLMARVGRIRTIRKGQP